MLIAPDEFKLNSYAPADRAEAWQALLGSTYTQVAVRHELSANFNGRIRRRSIGELSLAECMCDPHGGTRSAALIRREDDPCIGLQIVLAGSETFRLDQSDVHLAAGSAVLWSSREAFDFDVHETLQKVTLVIPFSAFGARIRADVLERGRQVPTDAGVGALLFPLVTGLTRHIQSIDAAGSCAIRRAVIELIVAAFAPANERAMPVTRSERHLGQVQDYILEHLDEAELRLCEIAASTGISLRYLHLLFERSGTSVSAWILNARLERCRDALTDCNLPLRSITDIAFDWGFSNTAYFSRAFKRRFGAAPSDCRRAVRDRLA